VAFRRLWPLAWLSASSLLAGCGGSAHAVAPPHLAHKDAARLISLANAIARDAPGNGCAARREIASLSAEAHALVSARRVPAALRAQLLSGVGAVVSTAPACVVTPASTKPQHAKPEHEHKHGHEHKDKGHH